MQWPPDSVDVSAWLRTQMRGDALCAGIVPGFRVVNPSRMQQRSYEEVGKRHVVEHELNQSDADRYACVGDFLQEIDAAEEFLSVAARRVLSTSMEVGPPVLVEKWERALPYRSSRSNPVNCVVLPPVWRHSPTQRPSDVPLHFSHAVDFSEVVLVMENRGHDIGEYVVNDQCHVRVTGSLATLSLPVQVWVLAHDRPRIQRVMLRDPAALP